MNTQTEYFFEKRTADLLLIFKGKSKKKEVKIETIKKLIDKCFDNFKSDNLITCVKMIRTILKDFDETLLQIKLVTMNNKYFEIRYDHKKMTHYQIKDISNEIRANYNYDTGLDVPFLELNPNMSHTDKYKENLKILQEIVENTNKLKNVNTIKLDKDGMAICKIYKLFYGEDPNFSQDTVHIKIQVMMYILLEYDFCLPYGQLKYGYDKFIYNDSIGIPISPNLAKLIKEYSPLGKVDEKNYSFKLSQEAEKTISIIGETIREAIIKKDDLNQLMLISRVLYAKKVGLKSGFAKTIDVANECECSYKEAEKNLRLIKLLDYKL